MRREKSTMGIESSEPCGASSVVTSSLQSSSSVAKMKEEGMEVKLGVSAMDLTLAITIRNGIHKVPIEY